MILLGSVNQAKFVDGFFLNLVLFIIPSFNT